MVSYQIMTVHREKNFSVNTEIEIASKLNFDSEYTNRREKANDGGIMLP
jgi:hypothetical protein